MLVHRFQVNNRTACGLRIGSLATNRQHQLHQFSRKRRGLGFDLDSGVNCRRCLRAAGTDRHSPHPLRNIESAQAMTSLVAEVAYATIIQDRRDT